MTDGIESALDRAKESAGDADISLGGGGSVVHQYLAAGLLDEIQVNLVPVILGGGTRLFDDLAGSGVEIEQVRVVETPDVTHLKYRVVK